MECFRRVIGEEEVSVVLPGAMSCVIPAQKMTTPEIIETTVTLRQVAAGVVSGLRLTRQGWKAVCSSRRIPD